MTRVVLGATGVGRARAPETSRRALRCARPVPDQQDHHQPEQQAHGLAQRRAKAKQDAEQQEGDHCCQRQGEIPKGAILILSCCVSAASRTEHATKSARAIRNLGHAVGDHRAGRPCPDHHHRRVVCHSMIRFDWRWTATAVNARVVGAKMTWQNISPHGSPWGTFLMRDNIMARSPGPQTPAVPVRRQDESAAGSPCAR